MNEPSNSPAATALTRPELGAPAAPDEVAHPTIEELARARIASRARALHLSQQLRINTIVDMSGWLRNGVELHYKRGRGHTIHPVMLRVGQDAADRDVLANGGILGRCRKYNEAIDRLRQLGLQLAAMVCDGRIQLVPRSEIASAHAELTQLDDLIAARQAAQMGHDVVRLDVLTVETAYFEARSALLTWIVRAAEQAASATWDGDTQDFPLAHSRTKRREVP